MNEKKPRNSPWRETSQISFQAFMMSGLLLWSRTTLWYARFLNSSSVSNLFLDSCVKKKKKVRFLKKSQTCISVLRIYSFFKKQTNKTHKRKTRKWKFRTQERKQKMCSILTVKNIVNPIISFEIIFPENTKFSSQCYLHFSNSHKPTHTNAPVFP